MEGENKGKPGPCPEQKQSAGPIKTDSLKQKIVEKGKAVAAKAKAVGKKVGEKIGADKIKQDIKRAPGLKLPEKTPGAALLAGLSKVPEAYQAGAAAGKSQVGKIVRGVAGASGQVQQTLTDVGKIQIADFRKDWGQALRGVQNWAKDPTNGKKLARASARLGTAIAGPYVRSFKVAQQEFGTGAAIAMSAAIGTSTHVTKPIQAAIFAATGVPLPSSLVNPVPLAVWGGAYVTRWAIKTGGVLREKFKQFRKAHDEWYASGFGGPLSKNSESYSDPAKAKIIGMMRQQRQMLENAIEYKLPELSDAQLWAMFVFHAKRNKAPQKMAECPKKFCMEGPNKGKPGPCPDPEKSKARAAKSQPKPSKVETVPSVDVGPTNAPAGSEEKIKIMQARLKAGLPLFHPEDGKAPTVKPKQPIDNQKKSLNQAKGNGTLPPGGEKPKPGGGKTMSNESLGAEVKQIYSSTSGNGFGGYDKIDEVVAKVKSMPLASAKQFIQESGLPIAKNKLTSPSRIASEVDRVLTEYQSSIVRTSPIDKPTPSVIGQNDKKHESTVRDLLANSRAGLMDLADMRSKMPKEMQGEKFDKLILDLADQGKVQVSQDSLPEQWTQEQKKKFVQEDGKVYTNVSIRDWPTDAKPAEAKPAKSKPVKVTPPSVDAVSTTFTKLYDTSESKDVTYGDIERTINTFAIMTVPKLREVAAKINLQMPANATKKAILAAMKKRVVSRKGMFDRLNPVPENGGGVENAVSSFKKLYDEVGQGTKSYADISSSMGNLSRTLTVPQLQQVAKSVGVEVPGPATKANIIRELENRMRVRAQDRDRVQFRPLG